ncbi:MAG: helix-turn-helix transcriptional regulator [Clostridia bacterium]|nr:helix-turn-helix transcriptional regulator [Clostridia bacterium]
MGYNKKLRDLREDNDLTQKEVADVLHTTYQYYSTYESGKRELPFSRAIELAKFYNVSLDYIAGLTDTPNKIK